jgi:hypothetical protein
MEEMVERTVHLPESVVTYIAECAEYHDITWEQEIQRQFETLARARVKNFPKLLATLREARKTSRRTT